jgi:hypothetical protein
MAGSRRHMSAGFNPHEGTPLMSTTASRRDHSAPLLPDERAVITRVVDTFPPLSQKAAASLAALLRPSGGDHFTNKVRATIRGTR